MPALYNKYRPQKLAHVRGQSHIKKILASQIDNDDLSHAYLFTGPAGTGKTSVARILAASVNCSTGQTSDPALDDEFVRLIVAGSSRAVDVVEMDAATNNGIEDIRGLREKLMYAPSMMHKKVVILDECHRLSPAAWEGLLKMLEEPPEYAIFILCTTEPDRVTETVKTRCMSFDFRSLPKKDVAFYLAKIAESEKIAITREGVDLLTSSARGSLRQGISNLEKLKHIGGEVTAKEVAQIVGAPSAKAARDFLRAVVSKDFNAALTASSSMISVGVSASSFIASVADLCHDMMVLGRSYTLEDCGYSPEEIKEIMELRNSIAEQINSSQIRVVLLQWIDKLDQSCKMSVYNLQPQFQVNYTFVYLFEIWKRYLTEYPSTTT